MHSISQPKRISCATGESYGGKYVPAIANKIIQNKDEAQKYFNFQGISVGDGFTDPINQIDTASLLYQIALVDDAQRDNLTATQNIAINQINNGKFFKRKKSIVLSSVECLIKQNYRSNRTMDRCIQHAQLADRW